DDVRDSFERFCLLWGIEAMEQMLEEDAGALCGDRHSRNKKRKGHRWGATKGPIGFHGG
ncbi:MAG: IS256 family transposase, partial [bacterium]|nr:IS256 family transposase [bacterium]